MRESRMQSQSEQKGKLGAPQFAKLRQSFRTIRIDKLLAAKPASAIRSTLESAGVIFLEKGQPIDGGPGVRLKDNPDSHTDQVIPMIDDDPEIEESPLCGEVTRDGVTVRIEIYRLVEGDESWTLEVIDHEGGSTVWDDRFATDRDAYAEFYRTLETEGIRSFLGQLSDATK